jgi:lysophospholipase
MAASKLPFDRRAIPETAKETVWKASDGWALRRIDWRAADHPRGSLLFLPGRGDHYEKYLETLDQLAGDGWHVTAIDWRGQGGSGRLLSNRHIGHIDDFSTWIADLRAFWADWKAGTPGPHVVLAHSMGGHLAMRALVEKAIDPDAVALSAPMLGIQTMGLPYAAHHAVAGFLGRLGDPNRAAWKEGEKPGSPLNVRSKILTHDPDRYADELFWWQARPEVRLGPPSWHWVERAIASTRMLAEPGVMEKITTPVLLMEAAHELLREADPVRDRCMAAIRKFFDQHAVQR